MFITLNIKQTNEKSQSLCYLASSDNYICYKKCLAWFVKMYVNLLLTRSTKRKSSLVLEYTYYLCLNFWSAWVCILFSFPWKNRILKQSLSWIQRFYLILDWSFFISSFHFINISGTHSYLLTFERTENVKTQCSPKLIIQTAGINQPKLKVSLRLDQNS